MSSGKAGFGGQDIGAGISLHQRFPATMCGLAREPKISHVLLVQRGFRLVGECSIVWNGMEWNGKGGPFLSAFLVRASSKGNEIFG